MSRGGSKINVLGGGGGYGVEALCPGGDTLILVISRVYNYIME